MEEAKNLIVTKGFKPYQRFRGKTDYLTIRKGNEEYFLGRFDQALHDELHKLVSPPVTEEQVEGGISEGDLGPIYGGIGRPPIPSPEDWRSWAIRGGIHSSIIFFYEYATAKGYTGSLSSFINESMEQYFREHNRYPAVVGREILQQLGIKPPGE